MPLLKLVPDNTNIDFLRWRRFAIVVSLALVAASIFFLATRGLNLGVDFVGGQLLRTELSRPVPIEQLRGALDQLDHGESTIQQSGGARSFDIRMPLPDSEDPTAADAAARAAQAAIRTVDPGARFDAVEAVSGKVSEELAWDGSLALLLAMLGISAYIWFRFEWQFGVGALVSLVHDLTITLGFFAATQMEFNLNVIAALLTLIGFSLNDTVVVYDRIRENLKKYRKMAIEPLLNLSVNETLARTIATNTAVFVAVLALVLIGPDVIDGLSVGILVGVIIGTYSSIYVARFLLVPLGVGPDSFVPRDEAHKGAERVSVAKGEGKV